jgi:hypothetical protein
MTTSKAFYENCFSIQYEVNWDTHTARDYFKLNFFCWRSDTGVVLLVFEDNHANNNTPSPRITIDITKVYINKGIDFIDNFFNQRMLWKIKLQRLRYNIKSVSSYQRS